MTDSSHPSFARQLIFAAAMVTALTTAGPDAVAQDHTEDAAQSEIAACIRRAAGGRRWLEATLFALRDQEGGWRGAEIANSNGSFDLGPMQVNSWWVPRIAALIARPANDVRLWLRDESCFNIDVARWIFSAALHRTGNYWKAVGLYHSPTEWRQTRYAHAVATNLTRRYGSAIFSKSAPSSRPISVDRVRAGANSVARLATPHITVFGFGTAQSTHLDHQRGLARDTSPAAGPIDRAPDGPS